VLVVSGQALIINGNRINTGETHVDKRMDE
jgi:hypothetical protein